MLTSINEAYKNNVANFLHMNIVAKQAIPPINSKMAVFHFRPNRSTANVA